MLTVDEGKRQTDLTEWIWPLIADETTGVQRMVLARLASLWLKTEPEKDRKELLDSLVLSIELRLAATG